jgi:hypothetical protein
MNDTAEILYVVCLDCGEAFTDLQAAADHELTSMACDGMYSIKPESEAM